MSNILAEKTSLGCFLADGQLVKETILHRDCFQNEHHRNMFDAIMELSKEESMIDTVTVAEKIGFDNLQRIGGINYLHDVYNSATTSSNFEQYEKILVDAWKQRYAITLSNVVKENIVQGNEDAISSAVRDFTELDEYGHKHTESKREVLVNLHETISKRDGKIKGVQSGFYELDKVTFGFKPGQLIIVGGRPAMGKTAFALCLAINAAMLDTCVTFFSLEMDKEELYERGISALGMIPNDKLRNPNEKFSSDDWQRYNNAFGKLERIPLEVVDKAGVTVKYIRSVMRRRIRENPNKKHLCLIDYVQLIHGNKRLKRHEEVAEVARSLKEMARDLKTPVIALAQLSRDIDDRQDKRPVMSDLRESGELEQAADHISFLYRHAYYAKDAPDPTLVELIVAKQRGGKTGSVPLTFIGDCTLMTNREARR